MLCGASRRLRALAKASGHGGFLYRFDYFYQSSKRCSAEPNYHDPSLGAMHEDEVTFVMGQPIFMFQGACCGKWGAKLAREPCQQTPDCVACWNPSFGDGY